MELTPEQEQDFDTIDDWRKTLRPGESVVLPRQVYGMPPEYMLVMPVECLAFDSFQLTKEHLDNMTDKEVLEFIHSHTHTIH